mmetsp:Transcript_5996/g.10273  ORF Transcript_5996/g.10273 Transcript_5996/m.10273 type:complete len:251 (-) Transcript_5996:1049-1801(-)
MISEGGWLSPTTKVERKKGKKSAEEDPPPKCWCWIHRRWTCAGSSVFRVQMARRRSACRDRGVTYWVGVGGVGDLPVGCPVPRPVEHSGCAWTQALEAHKRGAGWADEHGAVAGLRQVADELQLEVSKQHRPDGLDLRVGEPLAEAGVAAGAEAKEAVVDLLVLLTGREESVGVELVRLREHGRVPASKGGGGEDVVALRDCDAVVGDVTHDFSNDEDDWREHAEGLLDTRVEKLHVVQAFGRNLAVGRL